MKEKEKRRVSYDKGLSDEQKTMGSLLASEI